MLGVKLIERAPGPEALLENRLALRLSEPMEIDLSMISTHDQNDARMRSTQHAFHDEVGAHEQADRR